MDQSLYRICYNTVSVFKKTFISLGRSGLSCGTWAHWLWCMGLLAQRQWDPCCRAGIKPESPAVYGAFLTGGPPGKSLSLFLTTKLGEMEKEKARREKEKKERNLIVNEQIAKKRKGNLFW